MQTECMREDSLDKESITRGIEVFISEQSVLNGWTDATIRKFKELEKHLNNYDNQMKLKDFGHETLFHLVEYYLSTGMRNSTLMKQLDLLRWFLRWAEARGRIQDSSWREFRPHLTLVPRKVIFLRWEELIRLYEFRLPPGCFELQHVRDLFCLQCFTSLRFSDVHALLCSQVHDDHIELVTQKTADSLIIELNKYSRSILQRNVGRHGAYAMPRVSIQHANRLLKELCRMVGIDEMVHEVWYEGNKRCQRTSPKYQLISTHCGRRTFICNSLAMGIPAETVMQWTGHSNYNAMKPYIAIANEERRKAMSLWNVR